MPIIEFKENAPSKICDTVIIEPATWGFTVCF